MVKPDNNLLTWSIVRLPLFPGAGMGAVGSFSLLYLSHTRCGSGFQPGGTSSSGYLLARQYQLSSEYQNMPFIVSYRSVCEHELRQNRLSVSKPLDGSDFGLSVELMVTMGRDGPGKTHPRYTHSRPRSALLANRVVITVFVSSLVCVKVPP